MAQPRIASRAPAACAACYQQKPDRIHVDYAAALEGRLVDPSKPRNGHVDWVIICEDCLRNGVALLPDGAIDKVAAAEAASEALRRDLSQSQAYASSLEQAIALREHVHPVVTPAPRPEDCQTVAPKAKPAMTTGGKKRQPRYPAKAES